MQDFFPILSDILVIAAPADRDMIYIIHQDCAASRPGAAQAALKMRVGLRLCVSAAKKKRKNSFSSAKVEEERASFYQAVMLLRGDSFARYDDGNFPAFLRYVKLSDGNDKNEISQFVGKDKVDFLPP